MPLIITCAVFLAVGVVVTIAWGRERFTAPPTPYTRPPGSDVSGNGRVRHIDGLRLYAWWASVFMVIGTATGILITGAGGRLIMRLQTVVPLLLAVVLIPIGAVLAVGGLVTFALPRLLPWFLAVRASRGGVIVGRVLLSLAVLAALPAFVGAVVSIWGR